MLDRRKDCERCGTRIERWKKYCGKCEAALFNALCAARKKRCGITLVYAVGVVGDGSSAVKFGITTAPEQRLGTLQTGSPVPLEYLAQCPGHRGYEARIHRHLAKDRQCGEWFKRSQEALAVIGAMRANALDEFFAKTVTHKEEFKYLQQQNSADIISVEI